ncbi:PAS domain S-box protein [Methylobacterium brachiatum]|uniref:PAS domain S-box protein n=1 Tax=Methylobacterium brachiatum TaxID=269660 RepID=UPI000EFB76DE|nr:PAS domain S-box protein [Methylobacterium brachiatum]AYO83242.1 PAS domain S-box protein [Methylobacterium brachiatum]
MDRACTSEAEAERLRALDRYRLLDTPRERDFDEIAEAAAELCEAPIAVINLIGEGRQFFKAEVGLGVRETPLDTSFCRQAILQEDFLYVPDATRDPRFKGNPLVTGEPGLRFYAGALLKTDEGQPIGTVCVLDTKPHAITERQRKGLMRLARQTMVQMELRRSLREQAEQRLLHERILDSATDYAIIATDPQGRITRWNAGAERILCWAETEMLGRTVEAFFTPEDRAAGWPGTEARLSLENGSAPDERWHVRKDGTRFWASGETTPLRSEDGDLLGFLKILRDRTGQREAGAALKASELRYRSLVEVSPQVVWFGDAAGNVTYCNAYWYDYTGLPPGETGEASWMGAIHPDYREATRAAWLAASESGRPYEVEFPLRRADGQYRWFLSRAKPVRDEAGTLTSWIGTTLDIHERKVAEERFAALTKLAPAIIWFGNPDGSLSYLNDRWYAYTGQTPEQALPLGWGEVIHPDDLPGLLGVWEHARTHEVVYDTEARLRRHDGAYRWFLIRAEPLRDASGAVVGWLGSNSDIHDRRQAEERQRLLTGELQHRVKNTLAMVQAIASQTFRNAADLDAAREAFTERLISLGRAHDILTRSSWTEAPIAEVVEGALAVHRGAAAARIRTSGPNVLLSAKAALALALALHELATNAAKYGALSSERGMVDLRWHVVHEDDAPRFCLTWSEQGGPPILALPTRRGFGSRLIERSFAAEVGGEVKLTYAPTGLTCRLEAPLASLQEPRDEAVA